MTSDRSHDPRVVGAQIRMQIPNLTPLEARALDSMRERTDFSEATALKEVAVAASVSEAMIIKIAKKLGFSGYRDFRSALANYNRSDTAGLYSEISPDDTSREIVEKVFATAKQALEETLAILDITSFDRAASILHGARHRDFYGIGGSAQIARDAAHKFLRIGLRASVQDDAHMMLMSASVLGPEDAALAFSHSGTTSAVLEPLQIARDKGARTIAITNYVDSPISSLVDVVLCSTAQGSPLLGENAAARIAQLNILDALFVVIAQQDTEFYESNLNKTMNAVGSKRSR